MLHGLVDQVVDDGFDFACLAPHSKLLVGWIAEHKNSVNVFELFTRAEVVSNIVDELEEVHE